VVFYCTPSHIKRTLRRRTTGPVCFIVSLGTKNIQYKSKERCNIYLKTHQKLFGGWALPGPLGELTMLPYPLSGFKGYRAQGRGRVRRENKKGERGGKGEKGGREGFRIE